MYKLFAVVLLLVCSADLRAGTGVSALEILKTAAPGLASPVAPAAPVKATALPQNFYWSHTWLETTTNGGMSFSYAGRKYSVRLGFDRGSYDPYIKNYKPLPGIIFVEVTDPNAISHWGFKTFAEIQNSNGAYTLLDNKTVTFKYNGSSVWVVDQSGAPIASFNYSDLMAAWDQNARKYSKSYNANVQYFIPQSLWSGATGWRHGYVLSEYAPAYPNSGLPLDYMELYRGIGPHEIKPVAYSVPLGISCRYLGNQGSPWTWAVKELNEADFQDALADELN